MQCLACLHDAHPPPSRNYSAATLAALAIVGEGPDILSAVVRGLCHEHAQVLHSFRIANAPIVKRIREQQ